MTLVSNWKDALKWYSTQAMILAVALTEGWSYIPESLKQHVPDNWGKHLVAVVLFLGVTGRLVDQEAKLFSWFKGLIGKTSGDD